MEIFGRLMKANSFFAFVYFITATVSLKAQTINWQHRDMKKDSLFGMSTYKAYAELKNKVPNKVIVAVIDSGIDTLHNDLKIVLWTDQKTGIHGWNYIGAEAGREDVTLLVADKKDLYDSLAYTLVPEIYKAGYQQHRQVASALKSKIRAMQVLIEQLQHVNTDEAKRMVHLAQYHLDHGLNIDIKEEDTAAGNADVSPDQLAPLPKPNLTPIHGTHVAGIIGSLQYGVARNVAIMMLKTNGNIRELRDKSLAKAIRFAVDHGAKIINCSFAKPYTYAKKEVDEAVEYARNKDVLIFHGAGNDGQDNDAHPNYPDPDDRTNWIVVGASDQKGNAADFSNYGQSKVDIFAPGVDIYSTIPGNKYSFQDGTSMAAPNAAGVAALIRSYYPKLTAVQVKEIIMKSVVNRDVLKDKCVSGGVVNAYNALKLAATYK